MGVASRRDFLRTMGQLAGASAIALVASPAEAEAVGVQAPSPLLAGGHVLVVAAVGSGASAASLGCRSAGLDVAGPRCTPQLRWPMAKKTPMPLQRVILVLLIIKHQTPRREECLVIHGTHLCVRGCIILKPLPCREVHVCLGMVSDACVYTHLVHGQYRIVALESCISCLAQHIRGYA